MAGPFDDEMVEVLAADGSVVLKRWGDRTPEDREAWAQYVNDRYKAREREQRRERRRRAKLGPGGRMMEDAAKRIPLRLTVWPRFMRS